VAIAIMMWCQEQQPQKPIQDRAHHETVTRMMKNPINN
jgi:hypothetical protein